MKTCASSFQRVCFEEPNKSHRKSINKTNQVKIHFNLKILYIIPKAICQLLEILQIFKIYNFHKIIQRTIVLDNNGCNDYEFSRYLLIFIHKGQYKIRRYCTSTISLFDPSLLPYMVLEIAIITHAACLKQFPSMYE